ncbi:MAG: hypothetical protein JWM68_5205 [Verrucomicrobiales bacterium]|nr:hypothetical protein [Verrucomicrobiales bacterium]
MASNRQPDGEQPFFDWVIKLDAGALAKGAIVGLAHHTHGTLNPKYLAAVAAAAQFKTADAALSAAYLTLEPASEAVAEWLGTTRDCFKKFYGKKWSPAWIVTGFDDDSTAVPRRAEERRDRAEKVCAFLTATPARENAALDVTAAIGNGLLTTLKAAILAIPDKESILGAKKIAKDNAIVALRKEASLLVAELGGLIGDNDPLWDAFGLNRPDDSSPAALVEDLVLTLIPGGFSASWGAAANGHLYHVLIRIVGVDADYRNVKTTADLDATITGLTTGNVVDVQLVALNDAGSEGPRTEAQHITIA